MRKYWIDQIGQVKLDKPVPMMMAVRKAKRTRHCEVCDGEIEAGDSYLFDQSSDDFYCVACVGMVGDPETFSGTGKWKIKKGDNEKDCEYCGGQGFVSTTCPSCDGDPDEYYDAVNPVCPTCEGIGTVEEDCPYCNE